MEEDEDNIPEDDMEDDDNEQEEQEQGGYQRSPRNISNLEDKVKNGIQKVNGAKDKARRAGKAAAEFGKKVATVVKQVIALIAAHPFVALAIALVIIIIIAVIWLATEEEEAKETSNVNKAYYSTIDETTATDVEKKSKAMYETTGSLIYATDDQIETIKDDYIEWLKERNTVKYKILKKKYKKGDTSVTVESGAADINDSEEIYKHILCSEKYNFNRIIWQAYTRQDLKDAYDAGVIATPTGALNMKVNNDYELQYPEYLGDLGGMDELDFYIEKVFAYLQSWTIPISMIGGITDGGTTGTSTEDDEISYSAQAYNARFAYELLVSGYHRIDFDRYELYMREIIEDYRLYSETITPGTVTRTCTTYYKMESAPTSEDPDRTIKRTSSPVCVDSAISYVTGTTTEYAEYPTNSKYTGELASGFYNIRSYVEETQGSYNTRAGTDLTVTDKGNESIYQYDITKFRGFDFKFDKEYSMLPYKLSDQQMGVQESSIPYALDKVYQGRSTTGSAYVARNDTNANVGWSVDSTTQNTIYVTKLERDGYTYTANRTWQDQLNMDSSDSGNYKLEDIRNESKKIFVDLEEITDLSGYEQRVYSDLEKEEEINIIDIINARENIYTRYLKKDQNISKNMGYSRDYLEVSYYLLKQNLINLAKEYGVTYMWGATIVPSIAGNIVGMPMDGESLNVDGLDLIYPFTADVINDPALVQQDTYVGNDSYGYSGHSGIDISFSRSSAKADKSRCTDTICSGCADNNGQKCPYIKGPAVYAIMTGTLTKVTYSEHNAYYNTGPNVADPDGTGNLEVASACAVYITGADGTKTVYYHLYPDKDFFIELATHIGETINVGTFLGYMGNTGKSSGMHLHIENGTTLWQKNGARTLTLLNQGKANTLGGSVSQVLKPGDNVDPEAPTATPYTGTTVSEKALYYLAIKEGIKKASGINTATDCFIAIDIGDGVGGTVGPGITGGTYSIANTLGYGSYYTRKGDTYIIKVGQEIPIDVVKKIYISFANSLLKKIQEEATNKNVTLSETQTVAILLHKYQTPNTQLIKYISQGMTGEELKSKWLTTAYEGTSLAQGIKNRYTSEYILYDEGRYTDVYNNNITNFNFPSSNTPFTDLINSLK